MSPLTGLAREPLANACRRYAATPFAGTARSLSHANYFIDTGTNRISS